MCSVARNNRQFVLGLTVKMSSVLNLVVELKR